MTGILKRPKHMRGSLGFWIIFAAIFLGVIIFIWHRLSPDPTMIHATITVSDESVILFEETLSTEDMIRLIPDYVTVPDGGMPWDMFAKTESIQYEDVDESGIHVMGVRPDFTEELQKLNGKKIIMQGYMFPLEPGENQKLFLFGPFPASCPYHYHVGPALVIEAYAKEKLKFRYTPVTIEGTLELIPRDDEYNVFYRMHDVILK